MKFSEVIGHADIKTMLARGVDEGRVSHAQMFSGAAGTGTLPMALAYATYLNCTGRRDGDACGVCASCHKMKGLAHPDVHFVFPVINKSAGSGAKTTSDNYIAQWRGIVARTGGYFNEAQWYEQIEASANQQGMISRAEADEIIRKLSFKAFESRYKVMLVWLPEKMRPEAANALLKILEEPWDNTVFLMVSREPRRLLPTIISRVQEIAVPGVGEADMTDFLLAKYPGMERTKAEMAARLSHGDVIEADKIAGNGADEGNDDLFKCFTQLMRKSYNDQHLELLEWADEVASLGREQQKALLVNSLRLLRESYMLHAGMDRISYLWGQELAFCRNFAPYVGNHNIEQLVAEIETTIAQLAQNGNAKIVFSHFALTVSKMINRI